jgi:hypothetical protein
MGFQRCGLEFNAKFFSGNVDVETRISGIYGRFPRV